MLLDSLTCTGQVHPAKDDPAPNVNCAEVEPALEPPPDSFLPTLTGITVRTKTGSFKSRSQYGLLPTSVSLTCGNTKL